jgi:DNA-directed RNA polymerase subunit alpha
MNFEKPEYKITEYVEKNSYGRFELEPLERGFGTTIGNALRRVMLSSLPGSAVTSVKIDGVLHEFQKIDGIREDVTSIIINLKSLVVKNYTKEDKVMRLSVSDEGEVTAGMIEHDADIEIINPDLVICNLVKGGKIDIEMTVENGRGYVDAKENKRRLRAEHKAIVKKYFTKSERFKYGLIQFITLKPLRMFLASDKSPAFLRRAYKRSVNKITK